ncbi:MAG: 16S rRNA (cytidine(1402)-2'-O)-methyltransferase [Thermodesulforhabdaceae bacterium]
MNIPKGILFIVGTPIGNLKDITLRALEVLSTVDFIAAEDTRRTRKLLSYHNIHKPLISYHEHSPVTRDEEIISRLKTGENGALVTDAGMPGFSDPGFRLIRRVIEKGLTVTAIPGPSAILAALVISGFPPTPFAFLGFPPAKSSSRKSFFARYRDLNMTRVIFESPVRLIKTLEEIASQWGNPMVCVARELTKIFEEALRGSALEVISALHERSNEIKGEITIVVEGAQIAERKARIDFVDYGANTESHDLEILQKASIDDTIQKLLDENPTKSTRELAHEIANRFGISRRSVYKKIVELRENSKSQP